MEFDIVSMFQYDGYGVANLFPVSCFLMLLSEVDMHLQTES